MTDPTERELWRRAWQLCDGAEAVPAAELDDWLARQCAGDDRLEAAVRELLAPTAESAPASPPPLPTAMGPYELVESIGVGGMGQVFRGRHRELGRPAAIKVLPSTGGSDSGQDERFRREARLLAGLDHPGLVRIFEAGRASAEDGRPVAWFAMELVEGPRTLPGWVSVARPSPVELLGVFIEVADAVAHAHGAEVLHRDLKPSNILVDRFDRARVIDFGIGEVAGRATGVNDLTRDGTLVGTLNYLPPERLDGERADRRSDVYSLGLVFEEAVTGHARFDFAPTASGIASLREAQRRPAPTIEKSERVPAELGWIIARATEPEPLRRYADAAALAADLRRLQRSEPLEAAPAGRGYRARLFVQRHRSVVAATAAVIAVLSIALAATGGALVRESRALEREREASETARRALDNERRALVAAEAAAAEERRESDANANLVEFFRGVFERAPARGPDGEEYALDQALEDAWATTRTILADDHADPLQRGRLLALVGSVFASRLQWDRADELTAAALRDFEAAGAGWTEPWMANAVTRHTVLVQRGEDALASDLVERLIAIPDDAAIDRARWLYWLNLTFVGWWRAARDMGGLRLLEAINDRADRDDPAQWSIALAATHNLAALGSFEDPARSLALYLEVWDWRSANEPDDGRSYRSVSGAIEILTFLGRSDEGVQLADQALALAAASGLPEHHSDVLNVLENRAKCLSALGRIDEAIEALEGILEARRRVHGDRDENVLDTMGQLSAVYAMAERWGDAIAWDRAALALREEELGPDNYKCLRARAHIGLMEAERGNAEVGQAEIDAAAERLIATLGPLHEETVAARSYQAYVRNQRGLDLEALELQRALVAEVEAVGPTSERAHGMNLDQLCRLACDAGDVAVAVDAGRRAVATLEGLGDTLPRLVQARAHLALALALDPAGDPSEVHALVEAARAYAREHDYPEPNAATVARIEAALD